MSIPEINEAVQGKQVRVTMRDGTTREGVILSVETDSLSMTLPETMEESASDATAQRFPMSAIHAITRPRRTRPTLLGLGIGFGVGAAGTTALALSARDDANSEAGQFFSSVLVAMVGTVIMVATTGVGLLVGGANGQERTYIINP